MKARDPSSRVRRILVIDDDDGLRSVIGRHLTRRGFEVTELADADSVLLAAQQKGQYDLVLSDVHLGGVFSGVELMEILLAHAPLRPVVIITGDSNAGLAREALRKGAAGYLLKPFELFELDAVVREVLFRVELLEATRSGGGEDGEQTPTGSVPLPWLRLTDERSGAGQGHTFRVAQIANLLASQLPGSVSVADRQTLELAARAHELGRVAVQSDTDQTGQIRAEGSPLRRPAPGEAELAERTGQVLADLGVDKDVVATARSIFERWDGEGGPDGLSGPAIPMTTQILSVADAVDHAAAAGLVEGHDVNEAVTLAIDAVIDQSGKVFSPTVVRALEDGRSLIEALWVLQRGASY
ncbi:MAG: response regulator [Longimicrobiales bacterium]